jgi:MarR family transcriptional regulator for hemolysin
MAEAAAHDNRTWMLRLARAIHEFAHIQTTNAAKWMKPLGVSVAQSNVLIGMSWHAQINSSQLAKTLGLTKASVGRVVQDLIAMGLVEAQPDPEDRRASQLRLTAKGRKLVGKFAEIGREVNNIVMAGIDEPKGRELVALFEQMKTRTRMASPPRKRAGK